MDSSLIDRLVAYFELQLFFFIHWILQFEFFVNYISENGKKIVLFVSIICIALFVTWEYKLGRKGEIPNEEGKENDGKYIIPKGLDKMSQDFERFFLTEERSDVVLKVKDWEFRAHRMILMARSPVLRSMIQQNMTEKSNSIIIEDWDSDPDAFQDFLLYLYSGRVDKINASNVVSLYLVADKYDAKELKLECIELMRKEISVEYFGDVFNLALRHHESTLIDSAIGFFKKHPKRIIVSAGWHDFMKENPMAANELFIALLNHIIVDKKNGH